MGQCPLFLSSGAIEEVFHVASSPHYPIYFSQPVFAIFRHLFLQNSLTSSKNVSFSHLVNISLLCVMATISCADVYLQIEDSKH